MTTTTYRACYLLSADRQGEIVLTNRAQSHLDDDALMQAARSEMESIGMDLDGGSLVIGDWRE